MKDARTHDNTAKALAQTEAGNGVTALGINRLIAEIEDDRIVILILSIGHRSDVYKRKQ